MPTPFEVKHDSVDIPINSLIHNLSATFHSNICIDRTLRVDLLTYPWDFLSGVQTVLHNELTRSTVSPNASVAPTSVIRAGTDHFGTVIGNHCAMGASVIILPGSQIPPNTITQAGTVIGKKEIT